MHADLGTHSAHCTADLGDLTVTVLGLVVDAPVWVVQKTVEPPQWQIWVRPVLGQGCCAVSATTGVAQYLVRQWIHVLRLQDGFWKYL